MRLSLFTPAVLIVILSNTAPVANVQNWRLPEDQDRESIFLIHRYQTWARHSYYLDYIRKTLSLYWCTDAARWTDLKVLKLAREGVTDARDDATVKIITNFLEGSQHDSMALYHSVVTDEWANKGRVLPPRNAKQHRIVSTAFSEPANTFRKDISTLSFKIECIAPSGDIEITEADVIQLWNFITSQNSDGDSPHGRGGPGQIYTHEDGTRLVAFNVLPVDYKKYVDIPRKRLRNSGCYHGGVAVS